MAPHRSHAKAWYGHGLPYVAKKRLPGHLIAIEGTDGVGRSAQIELLRPWLELEGYAVSNTGWTRSPLLSETINEAKAGHQLTVTTFSLLYAADFADRLEHEILPALQAGFIVIADRYMYTAFARNSVMGADPDWTREVFGMALVPDLVLYLDIDVESLIPRVIMGKGMDYWESGMHLALGTDLFDSFERYQSRLIDEYRRLSSEFGFVSVDARLPIEEAPGRDPKTHRRIFVGAERQAASRLGRQRRIDAQGIATVVDESRSDAPPRRVTLSPGETVADAARKAIAFGAESLLRHQNAAESGEAEPLHQLRVATRRLRATIELFSNVIYAAQLKIFRRDIPWIGSQAGGAVANAT